MKSFIKIPLSLLVVAAFIFTIFASAHLALLVLWYLH